MTRFGCASAPPVLQMVVFVGDFRKSGVLCGDGFIHFHVDNECMRTEWAPSLQRLWCSARSQATGFSLC